MNTSARTTSFHSSVAARSVLGRPIALVLLSVLSIADIGVFTAYAARPLRSRTNDPATTSIPKAYVTNVNKRLKTNRLGSPNAAIELLQRLDSKQDKDEALPQAPEPLILRPSGPTAPDDDNDCILDAQSLPGDFVQMCVAAIAAYRKVAAIPHRASSIESAEHDARRHVTYA